MSGGGRGQVPNESRDHDTRDLLRFMYQTSSKGRGKSFQDWQEEWKQCMLLSKTVLANSKEGFLATRTVIIHNNHGAWYKYYSKNSSSNNIITIW